MTRTFKVGEWRLCISGVDENSLLSELAQQLPEHACDEVDLELWQGENGLHLSWHQATGKPLEFRIDVEKLAQQQRSFPAAKQGAFNQALGKRSKSVLDATGGWGSDALLMCTQGYQVTIVERHPIMAVLLQDAMERLSKTAWALANSVCIPTVTSANAINALPADGRHYDCVYLDPMFPAKRKKSAAVNKYMKLLQTLVGEDSDANELLAAALRQCQRVAVKRPDYATPLLRQPDAQFFSKLVHYDVYFA